MLTSSFKVQTQAPGHRGGKGLGPGDRLVSFVRSWSSGFFCSRFKSMCSPLGAMADLAKSLYMHIEKG